MADTDFTLTKDYLHQIFDYKDGELYWKINKASVKIGQKAGTLDRQNNRLQIQINNKFYKVHRIIFMMFYGYFPKEIDHEDGNPANNKIENLRDSTSSQNNYNQRLRKDNTSGVKGVSWDKQSRKWKARCWVNKKMHLIGFFDNIEQAADAMKSARIELHGNFARHN